MKASNDKHLRNSVIPFRDLESFDEHDVDIKSDYDFTKNMSQHHDIKERKTRGSISKAVSSVQTLLAHQHEIKKLQSQIIKLENEKLTLLKWVEFLY